MIANTFSDERDAEDLARELDSNSIYAPVRGRSRTSIHLPIGTNLCSERASALDHGREAFDQFERLAVSGRRDRLLGEQDDSPGSRVAPSL